MLTIITFNRSLQLTSCKYCEIERQHVTINKISIMGKRHRKGKTRFANTKGIDDALDEQMIEADTDDKRYGKQTYNAKQGVNSRNGIGGKVDRNQRRKAKNKKNVTKQRDIIQKGKLFAYNDLDAPNDSTDSPHDLRKLIISKVIT